MRELETTSYPCSAAAAVVVDAPSTTQPTIAKSAMNISRTASGLNHRPCAGEQRAAAAGATEASPAATARTRRTKIAVADWIGRRRVEGEGRPEGSASLTRVPAAEDRA